MARVELPIVVINSTTGVPIAGASVQVKLRSSGANATWWSAETGGTSSTSAIVTDSSGRATGWFDRGAYNAVISGTGITTYTEPWDAIPASDNAADALWLPDNVIANRHLADNAVSTAEIADNAVNAAKIAAAVIATSHMTTAAKNAFLQAFSGGSASSSQRRFNSGSFTTPDYGGSTSVQTGSQAHGLGTTPVTVVMTPVHGTNMGIYTYIQSLDGTNFGWRVLTSTNYSGALQIYWAAFA
jgi:hypothetical protein